MSDNDDAVIAWRNRQEFWMREKPWDQFSEEQREVWREMYAWRINQPTTRNDISRYGAMRFVDGDYVLHQNHIAELREARATIERLEFEHAEYRFATRYFERMQSISDDQLSTELGRLQEERDSAYVKLRCVCTENAALLADAERLRQFDKWADQGLCPHLVFNDNGWWAVTFDGGGDMSLIEPPPNGVFTAIVESAQWRQTVVEAIDAAIAARAQAEKEPQ